MSKNEHIDLEDKEDDIDIDDFDDNVVPDDSTEPSVPEGSGRMIEPSTEDSTSLGNNGKGKGKSISAVWEYMYKKYDDTEQVVAIICNLCKKEYGPKISTRPLMDHINKEHKRNISIKQQTRLSFIQKPYGKVDIVRVKDCLDATIDFIVGSQMPFSIVDSSWFKKLCSVLDQRYVLPSRQYLQQQILNRFANHHSLVADELERLSTKVSLTANVWTSITNQAYLGVTVHYIDDEWNMQHYLLDLIHFEYHHTGTRTKEKLLQLIDEMNLNGKVLSLTTDNDATMVLCDKYMTNECGIVWNDSEF